MESGASGMMEWVRRSVALKTWNDYNRTWEEWFHLEREMGGVETNTEKLGLLAWQLSRDFEAQVSISVVEKKLAALAFLFKFKGWPDFTKDFAIKQAVKGFKKGKKSTDHRRPITFNILGGLFDQLGVLANSPFEITLFKLAFSWAFFGAFRISELVSHNRAGNGGILARDVIRSEGSVSILIRDSKTDKQRKGFRVELFGIQGHHTCPVSCFDSYYSMRPDQQGSLMIHQDGSSLSHALQCKVWLMGHSFIHWAERRASVRHADRQLGFTVSQVKLHWVSRRGLRWDEIVPRAVQKAKESGPPNVILLHAGGNDLGICPMKALISTIRTDCFRLRSLFEGLIIIWSEIIPRTHWRGARSHRAINRVRIKVNKAVASNVQKNGGIVVRHKELENNMAFFRTDGIHLNEVGLDLFNFNLQEAIILALKSWRRMQS
uniref:SGNH hydrolase-type esterase domain-containing protein n=1 Tax=Xenopus tropicalis TaxID=8364 RepID=A0A1B8XUR0_XENTR